jgi:hypothetical protein
VDKGYRWAIHQFVRIESPQYEITHNEPGVDARLDVSVVSIPKIAGRQRGSVDSEWRNRVTRALFGNGGKSRCVSDGFKLLI